MQPQCAVHGPARAPNVVSTSPAFPTCSTALAYSALPPFLCFPLSPPPPSLGSLAGLLWSTFGVTRKPPPPHPFVGGYIVHPLFVQCTCLSHFLHCCRHFATSAVCVGGLRITVHRFIGKEDLLVCGLPAGGLVLVLFVGGLATAVFGWFVDALVCVARRQQNRVAQHHPGTKTGISPADDNCKK